MNLTCHTTVETSRWLRIGTGALAALLTACTPAADVSPSNTSLEQVASSTKGAAPMQVLATVAGQVRPRTLPFYGTDLGWTFSHKGELWVMFGDTWASWLSTPLRTDADDALGKISLADFPDGDAVERWVAAHPAAASKPAWYAAAPTMRSPVDARGRAVPVRPVVDGAALKSGVGLTPLAGFSNAQAGATAGAFGLFIRNEPLSCNSDGSCASGYDCDEGLGQCAPVNDLSPTCVLGTSTCRCVRVGTQRGLCQDRSSSVYDGSERGRSHSVAIRNVIGNSLRDAETDFAGRYWDTRRFFNATLRTAADFDAGRPNGAGNDYRPAAGVDPAREGVFVWGRPNFAGARALGRDAQLYLAWVPMPEYQDQGRFTWEPRYFAGLDEAGRPRFSPREVDAMPLDLDAETPGHQPAEVNDVIGQMSVTWLESQRRFAMIYGGGVGTELANLLFGTDAAAMQPDPLGSLFIRFSDHPWGPWSRPEPFAVSGAPELGVVGQYGPGGILFDVSCKQASCAPGEPALAGSARARGGLYAPSVIEPWIEPRPGGTVDLYWYASTWNPYQVVLVKSQIGPRPPAPP